MRKIIIYSLSALVSVVLGYEIYGLNSSYRDLGNKLKELDSAYEALTADNAKLREKIEYFSEPHNLEKELRERFNYKNPGEKLIIVTPPVSSE
ncbi:MAG: septum formation initiator family protein [Candidatus Colwellbacteria bacterium]|nr:septum formation initiator family protein [Candidatus Colwellbacteria bacterium]